MTGPSTSFGSVLADELSDSSDKIILEVEFCGFDHCRQCYFTESMASAGVAFRVIASNDFTYPNSCTLRIDD